MTTTICAAAADSGDQQGGGRGAAATTGNNPNILQPAKAAAGVPTGHYDTGLAYGTMRYALGVDNLVNDGVRVKTGTSKMRNSALVPYLQNHIDMFGAAPIFVIPQPPVVDFLASFTSYKNSVSAVTALESTLKEAIRVRDQQREAMLAQLNIRAAYVQQTSKGDSAVILCSGLGVRNLPIPVNFMPAPTNLRVDLNGEAGMMRIRWDAVPNAYTYELQCSPDVTPRVWSQLASQTKPFLTKTLDVGVTYVFRAAATGTPGISNWSPEVIRGAA